MLNRRGFRILMLSLVLAAFLSVGVLLTSHWNRQTVVAEFVDGQPDSTTLANQYVVLAWNDLGMHCYNRDFTDIAVLPPYNTMWAQVIKVGDPPQVITAGLRVEYSFTDNTYSVGKSNFWATSPYRSEQNAQWLFGLTQPLTPNIGLAGNGLSGDMEVHSDHFTVEGIPLTEFSDSQPSVPAPFQLATVIVRDASSGAELARTHPVAPVSTEMHCDYCHSDHGEGNENIATGKVETNILTKHDEENMGDYPVQYSGPLMNRRPVLCAWCHASNALGAPGMPGIPSLSRAMHSKHSGEVSSSLQGCYSCHPGPQTQCLRGVMSTQFGMECRDCHGTLQTVSQNPNPWFQEPRCDNAACHGSTYSQNMALFRMSSGHGGVFCEGCHDSPHAIAPSNQVNDSIKFVDLQGHNGPIDKCTVCHLTMPLGPGPHGLMASPIMSEFLPFLIR